MKRAFYFILLSALVVVSCSPKKAVVEVILTSVPDSTELIVSKLAFNKVLNVDTLYTKKGSAKFKADVNEGSPDFYYLFNNGKKLASLVLQSGDKIKLTGTLEGITSVLGSKESEKFNNLEKEYTSAYFTFDSLSVAAKRAAQDNDTVKEGELKQEMVKFYVSYKRAIINYIFNNSRSITTVAPLYYMISPNLPVFADDNDFLFYKRVYDSLQYIYPHSPYITSLADDLEKVNRIIELDKKISEAQSLSFPDISLYDNAGKAQLLSQFNGKVILLQFWTVSDSKQRVYNNDLKELYNKYHSQGLEIYQVSIDSDKTAWANVIKDQQLPWTCVCDPYGSQSQFVSLYNVTALPSMFLIDRVGNIVLKNEFDSEKLDKEIMKIIK